MNTITTLDKALDTVMQLPPDQQEMLIDIIRGRHIEHRRREIAKDAKLSLAAFQRGELKSQPVEDIIKELQQSLTDEAV